MGPVQQDVLTKIKQALTSETILMDYNVENPISSAVDASMKGLGEALIQDNGVIAYTSRTVTSDRAKVFPDREGSTGSCK